MTLVRAAVLYQQQIGVDGEGGGWERQQEDLVWQCEKISAICALDGREQVVGDEALCLQRGQIFFHLPVDRWTPLAIASVSRAWDW